MTVRQDTGAYSMWRNPSVRMNAMVGQSGLILPLASVVNLSLSLSLKLQYER